MTNQPIILEEPLLFVALNYVNKQLASPNGTGADRETLQLQRASLMQWIRWMNDNYYDVPITPVEEQAYYEPSAALEHFWIGYFYEKTHVPFNIVKQYNFEAFDPEAFRQACRTLLERHEILRTVAVFPDASGKVKQKILPALEVAAVIREVDARGEEEKEKIASQHFTQASNFIFDYAQGPLFYFTLLRFGAQHYRVIFNISHAIFDEWSVGVFEQEFMAFYQRYATGAGPVPGAVPIQFKDYCAWERKLQRGTIGEKFRQYWFSQNRHKYPAQNLTTYFRNAPLADFSYRESLKRRIAPYLKSTDEKTLGRFYGVVAKAERTTAKSFSFAVVGNTYGKVIELVKKMSCSTYYVLLAALAVTLSKITGAREVVFGANAALRDREEVKELIGFLVNTILIRVNVDGKKSLSNLVTDVIVSAALASFHKQYTMSKLLDDQDIPFNAVNTVFLNMSLRNTGTVLTAAAGKHWDREGLGYFDLDLHITACQNGLECWCNYNAAEYAKDQITLLFDRFIQVLDACAGNPDGAIDRLIAGLHD
ncbi:MAG: hypothetical protein ICV83_21085 [Cytophagales bacterium]|nr:hypothetical protein [Cytophagales bacterium]